MREQQTGGDEMPRREQEPRSVEDREALTEQRDDLNEARSEARTVREFEGAEVEADAFASLASRDLLLAAAAEYYADAVERTPPTYRGWLRRIICEAVKALLALRLQGQLIDARHDFGSILGSLPHAPLVKTPWGYRWDVFAFLEAVRREGFLESMLRGQATHPPLPFAGLHLSRRGAAQSRILLSPGEDVRG